MDTKRVILFTALIIIGYSLWTNWQTDYAPQVRTTPAIEQTEASSSNGHLLPEVENASPVATDSNNQVATASPNSQTIHVKTDVLDIDIDTKDGDIIGADLLNYPVSVTEKDKPFPLLETTPNNRYVANSDLFISNNNSIQTIIPNFTSESTSYQLMPGQSNVQVVLKGQTADGLVINKIFTFTKNSYLINVKYVIANEGSNAWKGYLNTQLMRSTPEEDKSSMFHIGSYTGASYGIPDGQHYKKVPFKDMTKGNLNIPSKGGWVAMQQHYFLTAWVPNQKNKNQFYTRHANGDYSIGAVSEAINIAPSEKKEVGAQLYLGPEDTAVLKEIAPGLDLTVDYGLLWFISSILFSVMKAIYSVVGNWGWAIVLVTVFIKLAFYRLSATSYRSMAAMRKLQPKLLSLRERYGSDKAKLSQATMELYRQEKVNPLGGCLPIVIQIPVFIALYWVLIESVELRQAPFIFWIKDLSVADPYHLLPIIMGATMLIQQRLNPAPPDPIQAKMMMVLPLLFTVLFWNFPAGLVLYWIVNNTLSILQQWYITRKFSEEKPKKKKLVPAK